MMTEQSFLITPPPELVREWTEEGSYADGAFAWGAFIATQAARWGADQELEACCEWLEQNCGRWELPAALRAARRPKPPSLKEQALKLLNDYGVPFYRYTAEQTETIRRALEQLDD